MTPRANGTLATLVRALGALLLASLSLVLAGPKLAAADGLQPGSLLGLTQRIYPVMDAPAPTGVSWCRATNPTCAPATWWEEHDQLAGDDLVQFSYLEPGLAAESHYAEAVALLSLWPEGQFLLHQAALHGVAVVTWPDALSEDALASYTAQFRLVRVSSRFQGSPTWLQAALLAHELKHAADDRAGGLNIDDSHDCFAAERQAFGAQGRFVDWLTDRQQGLPSRDEVRGALSEDDVMLYANVLAMSDPRRVEARLPMLYADECGTEFID